MPELEMRSVSALRPHPRNQSIYGDQADQEFIASVRENGVMEPLLITRDGLIVSGHRRWQAAQRAGVDQVPVIEFWSDDENEILRTLLEHNRQRVKTNEQIVREYQVWLELESWLARQRRVAALKQNSSVPANLQERTGEASQFAADRVGRKSRTMSKGDDVVQAIDGLEARGGVEMAEDLRSELNGKSV